MRSLLELRLQPGKFRLSAKALLRPNQKQLSLIELRLALELRLTLVLHNQPRKLPVSSQSAAKTEPYIIISSKSYGLASKNLLRLNAILKL